VTARHEQILADHGEPARVEETVTVALNSATSDAGAPADDRVHDHLDGVCVSEQVDDLQGVLDAGTSTTPELALVVASSSRPPSSGQFDGECLVDEVLREIDPVHRVAELSDAWATFSTSFEEKLQVRILFFVVVLSSFLFIQAFSQDQAHFFGSGEVEKKLSSEVDRLKVELAEAQSKLEAERQG
jgi:hypothetical protein